VLAEIDAVKADVVVLSTHGTESEDHASITEQVLARAHCSVLVLHDAPREHHTPHFASATGTPQILLVPTDLTPEANAAVGAACDLARRLPVELHLLYLLRSGSHSRTDVSPRREQAERDLLSLVPADLASRVRLHVDDGDPSEGIPRIAETTSADCIVMGQHVRSVVWRWFGRDSSRDVLRQAPCPVWYIPADRAA
jgi:nucleotide-binding universal stress UspA family protein